MRERHGDGNRRTPGSAGRADSLRWRERELAESDPVDTYAASGAYAVLGDATIVEPGFPEEQRDEEPTVNLGLIGGEIAEAVAEGRRAGKRVLVVGGNCAAVPGVVGGLQQAHGPAAQIGLVWFDAHGDFNTPRTTLSGMLGGMPVAVSAGLAYPAGASCPASGAAADRPHPDGRCAQPRPGRGAADPRDRHRHRRGGRRVPGRGSGSRRSTTSPRAAISSICTSTPTSLTSATSRTIAPGSRTARAWSRCWPRSTR